MINTLFSLASTFVGVNNILSLHILRHHSISQGCPFAPYIYVMSTNSLGYLLENAHVHGQLKGIVIPDASKLVNNHFADDSLLSL